MLRRLNSLGFKVEKIETSNLRNDHSKSVSKELARTSKETSKSHMGLVKEFSLHELQVATENFSDQNVLGRGGFGIVYKGRLTDGSLVAIKRLLKERNTTEGEQQFQTELQMIGLALHRNLLKLHGFCTTPKERLLVYPYMANGSVAARLKGSLAPLDWPTRLNVAYGAAKALAYLHDHCDPKIIHRDVKADNVLLDDDYEAIVADFGLVRLMNYKDSHVTTGPCGTPGHIAPEYFTNLRCSEKTDVYGYGILLLELVTGRRVYNIIPPSKREETGLLDWIKELVDNKDLGILVDSNLQGIYAYHEVEELIHVSLLCTRHSPKDRPQMSKVVRMLEDCRSATPRRRSLKRATKSVREKIKSFEFYKLEYATNFFSENNVLGRVSFGKVYKGRLPDGTLVAVKRLDNCARNGELQFQAEVLISETDIKHPNLLPLLGFCKSEQERLLLFPFMEKGSVASYLKGYPNSIQLPPERQKHIALGVARGLSYLHNKSNASNVHVDIKAENIWLDDYFNAAIGDFGLLPPKNCQLVRELRGTGYMAPEHFQTKKSSYKTDVFAYGVLLLELLTGLRAYDFYQLSAHRKGMGFVQGNMLVNAIRFCLREFGYVGLDDCTLVSYDAIRKQETEQLLQLALLCTQTSELSRPKMSKVVEILEGDGWIKGHVYWKEVLKEVEFHKSIGTRSKKEANEKNLSENCVELPPCHEDWTADDIERIAALEKWISKYARSRWWNSVPAINRFPYLKESEMSLEELDGTLSALGLKYADWFGERI